MVGTEQAWRKRSIPAGTVPGPRVHPTARILDCDLGEWTEVGAEAFVRRYDPKVNSGSRGGRSIG